MTPQTPSHGVGFHQKAPGPADRDVRVGNGTRSGHQDVPGPTDRRLLTGRSSQKFVRAPHGDRPADPPMTEVLLQPNTGRVTGRDPAAEKR
jgi:hypothetical protein